MKSYGEYQFILMSCIGKIVSILIENLLFVCLTSASPSNDELNMTLVPYSDNVTDMVSNGSVCPPFSYNSFHCSVILYTYNQTNNGKQNNYPYSLNLSGLSLQSTQVTITDDNDQLNLTYSPKICWNSTGFCLITVHNNCVYPTNQTNYFYRVMIDIQGYQNQLSYYVLCEQRQLPGSWQWGLAIEIVAMTFVLGALTLCYQAWSLQNFCLQFDLWWIVVFNCAEIFVSIIRQLASDPSSVVGKCFWIVINGFTFVVGVLSVAVCVNEILFMFNLKILKHGLFNIRSYRVRVLEVVSSLVSTGALIGWYFSDNNILVDDLICLCMVVAFIKILHFGSLKLAGLAILTTVTIELIFQLIPHFQNYQNYNVVFINRFNSPFLLQIPMFSLYPIYNMICSWLSFTSVVFSGMLLTYLHRFDASRKTNLYLITGMGAFFVGGLVWIGVSIPSEFAMPVGLVIESITFGLVCLFAFKRQDLGKLWRGQFIKQFEKREDLVELKAKVQSDKGSTIEKAIESNIMRQLKQGAPKDSSILQQF